MVEVTSQQGVVLALVSLATLGFVSAICLGCRKKSKIVQEDNQLYIPQIFQREGSRFAVTRSKTVTRPNQITSEASPTVGNSQRASYVQPQAVEDIQGSYQNISKPCCGSLEPTYVHPIPTPPVPDELTDNDIDGDAYENVFPTKNIDHYSDSEDYENADFLKSKDDEDEPDYVNAQPD
ncbi:LAT2 domain-containing protein isoform X2 [Colossoma macropomum]|uniref:LAT2 domain-containing protein isoform X2 n=1 Tax=Colossoma macropomum TaxID=42526 RepID=UPI001863AA34|nr:LAT2 domain-containing protein isoform X2 [Colossoma macropomum]